MDAVELRVITGPTAAGKSAIALHLAERHGAAIISADSRQVYRGFDIGTAKPGASERARVDHFGIDVADPVERYSAARWSAAAHDWIGTATRTGRDPVLVGGTGFYLRALFAPLFEEPPLDALQRAALQRELANLGTDELRRRCELLDPARASLGRAQLLRAIEVFMLTGERVSALHARGSRPSPWKPRYLVVDPGPVLRDRIAARMRAMLAGGWVDEVRALVRTVPGDAPAWNAAGYMTIRLVVSGASTLADASEQVVITTRQYAKRQRTWLRHQLGGADVTLLNPDAPGALDRAERWWSGEDA